MILAFLLFHTFLAEVVNAREHDELQLLQRRNVDLIGMEPFQNPKATKSYVLIHIPKTAGSSLRGDGKAVVAPAEFKLNFESSWVRTVHAEDQVDMVMLRFPLDHVLSQFMECKYDQAWKPSPLVPTHGVAGHGTYGGFEEWVDHFLKMQSTASLVSYPVCREVLQMGQHAELKAECQRMQKAAYDCYNPWNMQTRYLSEFWDHFALSSSLEPKLAPAVAHLKHTVTGVVEFYNETLCVLYFQRHGTVPSSCSCGGAGALPDRESRPVLHGLPHHALSELPTAVVKRLHGLIRQDAQLYAMGLHRLEEEAKKVREATEVEIFCEEPLAMLWDRVEQMLKELDLTSWFHELRSGWSG
ncbi:unnamed protein product [Durusdinium trenchii]|uniref:Sulfotransferase n=1 Tax=Durusdinium trenchii TaxID=1381693 RepID=A0ABP0SQN4_9DINO